MNTETKYQNTSATEAAQTFGAVFANQLPACTINNGRFIGTNNTADYYEIGCENEPAFILATSPSGRFIGIIDCEKTMNGGGCQFSSPPKSPADSTPPV